MVGAESVFPGGYLVIIWLFKNGANMHVRSLKGPKRREIRWPSTIDDDGVAYGVLHGAMDAWKQTLDAGYHWLYADGPYWASKKGRAYRLVWDQMWFNGSYGPQREGDLKSAGCVMLPWKQGDDIIVAPSNHMIHEKALGIDADTWVERTIATLRQYTDRKIVVRWKPGNPRKRAEGLAKALKTAWAVVTSGSTIGVESVCRGVPVFSTQPCAASPVALSDLSMIESPIKPEREAWAKNLAARQFSIAQIQTGEAWRICQEDLVH